jgi:transposase
LFRPIGIGQKKLEKDRFPWPRKVDTEVVELSGRELNWLLDGVDVFSVKPHDEVFYEAVLQWLHRDEMT